MSNNPPKDSPIIQRQGNNALASKGIVDPVTGATIAPAQLPARNPVLYIPRFTNINQVCNPSGLAIHSSGVGLVAAVEGTAGTGYIDLPRAITLGAKFSIHVLGECNEVSNPAAFAIRDVTGNGFIGLNGSFSKNAMVWGAATNITPYLQGQGAIPTGMQYLYSCVSDGTSVTGAAMPYNNGGPNDIQYYNGSLNADPRYLTEWVQSFSATATDDGALYNVFAPMSRVTFSIPSTVNRIIGLFICIGDLQPNMDSSPSALKTPIFHSFGAAIAGSGSNVITSNPFMPSGDVNSWIFITGNYGCSGRSDLVWLHHPNGNYAGNFDGWGAGAGPLVCQLVTNGFSVMCDSGVQGNPLGYNESTAMNWGAPLGGVYRKLFHDTIRTQWPLLGRLAQVGLSMGGIVGLNLHKDYPELQTAAIAGGSPVTDIGNEYTNLGGAYQSIIQKAYALAYVCIQAGTGHTPSSSPTYWTPLNFGKDAPLETYFTSTYNWRDAYAAGTAYAVNDIVIVPSSTFTAGNLYNDVNPRYQAIRYVNVPFIGYMGTADTTLTTGVTDLNNTVAAINGVGGQAISNIITGANHIDSNIYSAMLGQTGGVTGVLSFLQSAMP